MLDEIERRVEHLREIATQMEQEREALLEMLGTLQMNKDMLRLGHGTDVCENILLNNYRRTRRFRSDNESSNDTMSYC